MVRSNDTVRYMAIFLALLFVVPSALMFDNDSIVSAGVVQVKVFDGGITQQELSFVDSKINTSLGLKIPKASVVKSFSMDVAAKKVTEPGQMLLDTKDEFLAASPSNMELNKTYGNAYLIEKPDLSDDFNDGSLDLGNFTWTNPPTTVNENLGTGELEITSDDNVIWWNNTQTGHFLHKDVTGNFKADIKLSATPDKNYTRAGLMVFSDSNNWLQALYRWVKPPNNNPGGPQVGTASRFNGNPGVNGVGMNSDPVYFRITRHFSQFTTYYSNNGAVYTQHRQYNLNWPDTLQLGIFACDGYAANGFRADFDYFKVSRFIENGTLSVGPIATPYPVKDINFQSDLSQLEYWETYEVSVRANSSAPFQTFVSGGDHTLTTPGTEMEMQVFVDGMGWTSPTIRMISVDYFPESWPSDVTIDVGDDSSIDWQWNGTFSQSTNINDVGFVNALNSFKDTLAPDGEGYVHIPLKMVSQTPGNIDFSSLVIDLFVGSAPDPPVLGDPESDVWTGELQPKFNFSSLDPDADFLYYQLEISEDDFSTLSHRFNQMEDTYGWSQDVYYSEENAEFQMYSSDPLQHGKEYKWRVKAFDGGWWSNYSQENILKVDASLPTGKIIDDGEATPINREIFGTVQFSDAESGVTYVECGLGTSKNKTDIVEFTPIGFNAGSGDIHFTNLTLQNMKTYYFTARAKNGANMWSVNVTSNGIRIDLSLDQKPVVEVLSPSNRTVVDGTITISGIGHDPDPSDSFDVLVAIDSGPWQEALGDSIWSLEWDTTTVQDGEHSIYVKAFDGKQDGDTVLVLAIVGNNRLMISDWMPDGDQTITELDSLDLQIEIRDPAHIFRSYTWKVDDINVPNLNQNNFTYDTGYDDAGSHTIEAQAMGVGMTVHHKWNITVLNLNRDPKALISSPKDKASYLIGDKIWFDGAASIDPDGEQLTYRWEFSDGDSVVGKKVQKKFKDEGTQTAKLIVTDPYNSTSESEISVKIMAEEVDIVTQFTTMPLCLAPLLILVILIVVVILVVVRKKKRAKEYEAKLIDEEVSAPGTHYDPTPQQPLMGQSMTPSTDMQQPPQQQDQYPPQQQQDQYPPQQQQDQYPPQQQDQYPPQQQQDQYPPQQQQDQYPPQQQQQDQYPPQQQQEDQYPPQQQQEDQYPPQQQEDQYPPQQQQENQYPPQQQQENQYPPQQQQDQDERLQGPQPSPEPESEVPKATAHEAAPDSESDLLDEEASKAGPAWGPASSPFGESTTQDGDGPSGPAWTEKKGEEEEDH